MGHAVKAALFCLLLAACGGPPFTLEGASLGNGDAGELERVVLPNDAGAEREAAAGELDALGNGDRLVVAEKLPNEASDARALDAGDASEAAAGPVHVGGACDGTPWQANECEMACQLALQGHGSCPEGVCICR